MKVLALDVEGTVQWLPDGKTDNSPFNPANRLVSVGYAWVLDRVIQPVAYDFFFHNEFQGDATAARDRLQQALNDCDLLVAHNAKFDLQALLESGFTYDGPVWCTMIGEYVLARAQKLGFSLEDTCERRNLSRKRVDLTADLFRQKIGFEAMPIGVVTEYGIGDVQAVAELYVAQAADYESEAHRHLEPTRQMMCELLPVLCDMERNGVAIDLDALAEVEAQYKDERDAIIRELTATVYEVMGDTPVNLNSPEQLCWVIYSRQVRDKKAWARAFNIGTDWRGKPLRRPTLSKSEFNSRVRENTVVLRKTRACQCPVCKGSGTTVKLKKDGELAKRQPKCKECGGTGIVYENLKAVAGLKMIPTGVHDCTSNGFGTDKETLGNLALHAKAQGNEQAARFLTLMVRLNAIETYLSSFVGGIKRGVRADGILHAHFNQCVAATGRLSSTDPNLHNFPRGLTFPVRRAFTSRFKGGKLCESDFAQLEFRVAGELSGDKTIFEQVRAGVDVHKQTATIIFQCTAEEVTKSQRQDSKPFTFAPLYGGMGMSYPDHIREYFRQFPLIYTGVADWHVRLQNEAITTKLIRLPSGREFSFPNAKRTASGGSTYATQIKNFPVQSFATADIVPCCVIEIARRFKQHNLYSLLVNTVHDSIVVDIYPGEEDEVYDILQSVMRNADKLVLQRYGYQMTMPLDCEIKQGANWMEMQVVPV